MKATQITTGLLAGLSIYCLVISTCNHPDRNVHFEAQILPRDFTHSLKISLPYDKNAYYRHYLILCLQEGTDLAGKVTWSFKPTSGSSRTGSSDLNKLTPCDWLQNHNCVQLLVNVPANELAYSSALLGSDAANINISLSDKSIAEHALVYLYSFSDN